MFCEAFSKPRPCFGMLQFLLLQNNSGNGTDLCYGKRACHLFFLSVVSKLLLRKWFSGYIECRNVEHDGSATTTHTQSYNGQRDAA